MFSSAEIAYGTIDFSGTGTITEEAFLDSIFVKERQPYSREQIQLFFKEYNIYGKNDDGLTFDNFKKIFFPHLYAVQEDKDDIDELKAQDFRQQIKCNMS